MTETNLMSLLPIAVGVCPRSSSEPVKHLDRNRLTRLEGAPSRLKSSGSSLKAVLGKPSSIETALCPRSYAYLKSMYVGPAAKKSTPKSYASGSRMWRCGKDTLLPPAPYYVRSNDSFPCSYFFATKDTYPSDEVDT